MCKIKVIPESYSAPPLSANKSSDILKARKIRKIWRISAGSKYSISIVYRMHVLAFEAKNKGQTDKMKKKDPTQNYQSYILRHSSEHQVDLGAVYGLFQDPQRL